MSIQKAVWELAEEKGWHEKERDFPEIAALIHSEVSEALEEYRKGRRPDEIYETKENPGKPEGIPIELADVIIRIYDWAGDNNVNMEEAIMIKHAYNKTRPYRHGGKKI